MSSDKFIGYVKMQMIADAVDLSVVLNMIKEMIDAGNYRIGSVSVDVESGIKCRLFWHIDNDTLIITNNEKVVHEFEQSSTTVTMISVSIFSSSRIMDLIGSEQCTLNSIT